MKVMMSGSEMIKIGTRLIAAGKAKQTRTTKRRKASCAWRQRAAR
jgi:hypothetical protein